MQLASLAIRCNRCRQLRQTCKPIDSADVRRTVVSQTWLDMHAMCWLLVLAAAGQVGALAALVRISGGTGRQRRISLAEPAQAVQVQDSNVIVCRLKRLRSYHHAERQREALAQAVAGLHDVEGQRRPLHVERKPAIIHGRVRHKNFTSAQFIRPRSEWLLFFLLLLHALLFVEFTSLSLFLLPERICLLRGLPCPNLLSLRPRDACLRLVLPVLCCVPFCIQRQLAPLHLLQESCSG